MRRIFFYIVALFLILTSCTDSANDEFAVSIIDSDNNKTFNLAVSEKVKITLASNPTTGYLWENASSSSNPVILVKDSVFEEDQKCVGLTGCSGYENFEFEAITQGVGTILLAYKRPSETTKLKEFTVKIIVSE